MIKMQKIEKLMINSKYVVTSCFNIFRVLSVIEDDIKSAISIIFNKTFFIRSATSTYDVLPNTLYYTIMNQKAVKNKR